MSYRQPHTVLSVFTLLTVACSIHPGRDGVVGVYRAADADVPDLGTPVGDASGDSPDVPSQTPLDSGQCVSDGNTAVLKPLDIYAVFEATPFTIAWWDAMNAEALLLPASANISMGASVILPSSPCDSNAYATPTVSIAPLPYNLYSLMIASRPTSAPFLPLPILPALQGAIQYARGWAQSHPNSKVVVWLITDGMSDKCNASVEQIAGVAAEGYSGSISIPTYVVGIGDPQALNTVANAGGTEKAIIIAGEEPDAQVSPDTESLLDALNKQRGSTTPCDD